MIKRNLIIIVAVLFFLPACNNKDEKRSSEPVTIVTPEEQLKDAVAKFPDSLSYKVNLVQYYRDSGDYDKAIIVLNDAIQKDSNNAGLWDMKATVHFENGDTINSIKSFEKAIGILPDPGYLISLGILYAQTKNIKALRTADLLMTGQKASANKEALFIKGLYYSYLGDKMKAIVLFDQCLSMDYTFMFAYREKAIALYDMGKYEDALKVLDKAVTLQNNFDEGYYWRGRCLEKLNRTSEAIEEYRTALLYSKDFIEAKEALARLGAK